MGKKQTIQTRAAQLYKHLKQKTRRDGTKFYALDGYGEKQEWMLDVIRAAHGDSFPDDTIYEFIYRIAGHLTELDVDTPLYEAMDSIYEIEPDIYTHDLTMWLHASLDHLWYLDVIIQEYGVPKDGFSLLQQAQQRMITDIGNALVDAIDNTLKTQS